MKIYILLPLCFVACIGCSQHKQYEGIYNQNRIDDVADTSSNIKQLADSRKEKMNAIDTTGVWYQLTDSMVVIGKHYFTNDRYSIIFIEKLRRINTDLKVYNAFSHFCKPNVTLFFIYKFKLGTGIAHISLWEKAQKKESPDVYVYRLYRYKKEVESHQYITSDSVKISHNPEICNYSEKFIQTCNNWDTISLRTKNNLDVEHPTSGDTHILVYRVDIKKKERFTIQCVKVINQGDPNSIICDSPTLIVNE